jgi:hypothetical protein
MNPEEKERMIKMELQIEQLLKQVNKLTTLVEKLDKQSSYVRGGILVVLAVGGIITFFSKVIQDWFL